MIKIAIADDDLTICAEIDKYLKTFFVSSKYELDDYADGAELINAMNEGTCYDIIFLDIEMRRYDGIKTAELIRRTDPMENIYIIYVSSHEDNLIPLFRFHPFGFLSKPLSYTEFKSIMKKLLSDMNSINLRLPVHIKRDTIYLPLKEITYMESQGRKLIIHLFNSQNTVEAYCKINEILNELNLLSDNFCQLHRSYIVNQQYIDRLSTNYVIVQGTELPISSKYRHMLMHKQYTQIIPPGEREVR